MESAPNGRASGDALRGAPGPGTVAAPLHRALEEGEVLLRQAQETAAALRRQAEREAARAHRDVSQQVFQRINHAAGVADRVLHDAARRATEIVQDAEARQADVERHLSELRRSSEETAARTILEAEQAADDLGEQAQIRAVAMLGLAWRQSVALQQDLLDEIEAEADDVLGRAEADAASLRRGAERLHAEAHRLREEAARTRRDARRYANELCTAALLAAPEPEIHDTEGTHFSGRTPHRRKVVARQPEPGRAEDVDRLSLRFSFVVLVLALLGGIAVYLADGLVLAPALPAAALLALGAVVLAHRLPALSSQAEPEPPGGQAGERDHRDVPAEHAAGTAAATMVLVEMDEAVVRSPTAKLRSRPSP